MRFLALLGVFFLTCCDSDKGPDTIIYNGAILTMNDAMDQVEAVAMRDGIITAAGQSEEMLSTASQNTQKIDLKGAFMTPGFIEGHGHFRYIGEGKIELNFLNDTSWTQIVQKVAEKAKNVPEGHWIVGRGWHQEKWTEGVEGSIEGYPDHITLSALTPDHPVLLDHASGHSIYANQAAMELAGVSKETIDPEGGRIVRNNDGEAIGVFEERAEYLIQARYQDWINKQTDAERATYWRASIDSAQIECLRKGITSFQDAGSLFHDIDGYKGMAENGELDIRLWVMLRHPYDTLKNRMNGFPIPHIGNNYFTCQAIKSEVDGALGSYGAWLLSAYNDKPGFHGQNTTPIEDVEGIADLALKHNMQLCVHAIGDRANREVLKIMEQKYAEKPNADLRWRIEHAQHMHPKDITWMQEIGVIPSMQGVHCTSDAPFVNKRLGELRAKLGAYAWRSILDTGSIIANGTDAPVEDVDPIKNFYASVTRKRVDNGLEFYVEQRMTREEALKSYTIWNAYAAKEEHLKGSIEQGKLADFTVFSNNLLNCTDDEILDTEIVMTIVGGEVKYENLLISKLAN